MAGHSKWATTKHRKAAQDKKRSALFSKLSRMITVAARTGGDPNPENNAALATAVAKAKSYSLPKDRIESAIAKAFGGGESTEYEATVYEGYGPAGVALYVEALTDNRNRTAADVRSAFSRAGGSLGASGSVAFQFERVGEVFVEGCSPVSEDDLVLLVVDAGGEDLQPISEGWLVRTKPEATMSVKATLEDAGMFVRGVEIVMDPRMTVSVTIDEARKVFRLIDALEDLDDVQSVYHNMALTEEIASAFGG